MAARSKREISAEWASHQELRASFRGPGRIAVQKIRRSDDGAAVGKGEIVALVLHLHDKEYEFRTLAMVLDAPASGDLEIEILPEESHVRELLEAYSRGEGIPYAHRYGRRARLALRVEFAMPSGSFRAAMTRDIGEGGAWILCGDPPAVGETVTLRIHPPDDSAGIDIESRVVASRRSQAESGIGVEFRFADRAAARDYQKWFGDVARSYSR